MIVVSACILSVLVTSPLSLPGQPLQLEWVDINSDRQLDLVALMLVTTTNDSIETYYSGGTLRGIYEEETEQQKILLTYLSSEQGWQEAGRLDLTGEPIHGMTPDPSAPGKLIVWRDDRLESWTWQQEWQDETLATSPRLILDSGLSNPDTPFWVQAKSGSLWLVPDVHGLHLIGSSSDFIAYPDLDTELDPRYQRVTIPMPRLLLLDGDAVPEIVFPAGGNRIRARWLESQRVREAEYDGDLFDLNGDQRVDLIQVQESDIDGPRDLDDVTSHVKVYHARRPLEFPDQPDYESDVNGFVINTDDGEGPRMTNPYFDVNGDGLMDIAGVGIKMSLFQIAKLVSIGRMKLTFLLYIHVQQPQGGFRLLPGGPHKMKWKLNIRRLSLPEFAQLTADFNGDGWTDIYSVGDKRIEIIPLSESGHGTDDSWRVKLPKPIREPDEVFGRDLDQDGKAELVVIKLNGNTTTVGILGGTP